MDRAAGEVIIEKIQLGAAEEEDDDGGSDNDALDNMDYDTSWMFEESTNNRITSGNEPQNLASPSANQNILEHSQTQRMPRETRGEGDCLFHAVFGKWNQRTREFECDDDEVAQRRTHVAKKYATVNQAIIFTSGSSML